MWEGTEEKEGGVREDRVVDERNGSSYGQVKQAKDEAIVESLNELGAEP